MKTNQVKPQTIEGYIRRFPPKVQAVLRKIRTTIRRAAPEAEETIAYQMPAFTCKGNLVYFAAFTKHIGFYPHTTAIAKFKKELARYEGAKGSVRFPLDKPAPYDLIGKMVRFRLKENLARARKNER